MSEEYIGITTLLKELDQAFHADLICKQDVINLIINLPTTRVVDVVRCNDCKHNQNNCCMGGTHDHQILLKPNDFCSYGERRDKDG